MKKLVIMAALLGMAAGAYAQGRFWVDELAGATNPTHNFTNSASWWDGDVGFGYGSGYTLYVQDSLYNSGAGAEVPIPNGPVVDTDITAGFTTFFHSLEIGAHPEFSSTPPVGGQLTINNGGVLGTTNLVMGAAGGSTGALDMSGNSTIYVLNTAVNGGTGTVNMSGSSTYESMVNTRVADVAGGTATMNLNLSDTATYHAQHFGVGWATGANGTLDVSGAGILDVVTDLQAGTGAGTGGFGTVNLNAGSVVTVGNNLVADSGTINAAGTVGANGIYATTAAGTVNISGAATSTGNTVAQGGGTVNVLAGGSVTGGGIVATGTGGFNVAGTAHSTGDIASDGGGTLTVQNGGQVTSGGNIISYATITVDQGGTLTAGSGILAGNGAGSAGVVNINGTATGSGWDMIAGWNQSAGTINVGATGVANARNLLSASYNNAVGDVNVDGTLNVEFSAFAGFSGNGAVGTVTVNSGGLLDVTGNMLLGQGNATDGYSSGVLNMDGGRLNALGLVANTYTQNVDTANWDWVGGESQINLNAGEIWADGISGFQEHANIDIEEGAALYIKGDVIASMAWYESLGTLTANDGTGTIVMDFDTTTTGYTTITAIPEPATLGMIVFLGGGLIWIRKRFMI